MKNLTLLKIFLVMMSYYGAFSLQANDKICVQYLKNQKQIPQLANDLISDFEKVANFFQDNLLSGTHNDATIDVERMLRSERNLMTFDAIMTSIVYPNGRDVQLKIKLLPLEGNYYGNEIENQKSNDNKIRCDGHIQLFIQHENRIDIIVENSIAWHFYITEKEIKEMEEDLKKREQILN